MIADLIVYNIKTLYHSREIAPVKGNRMKMIETLEQPFLAIKDGKVLQVGVADYSALIGDNTLLFDAQQKVVVPGFIDSHSHLVHAGSRENEFEQLRQGVPYLDILKAGGGILGTVEKTRKASFNELYNQAKKSLDVMLSYGVTTLEAKSGYGLDYENEVKQLEVMKKLNDNHPVHLVPTYMAAHAVPKEFSNNKRGYIDAMLADLEKIKATNLTEFVDVFCETGVFDLNETREILEAAKTLGFKVKLHADEIDPLGGAGLGAELGATSVDHLMAIKDEDIVKLAKTSTILNILPGTSFYLNKTYARARDMIEAGCALSVSGDYNPGSCPTENFQLIMQLAANYLKLTPEEILTAVTQNAAYHLGLASQKGSLEPGKDADFLVLDIPNLAYLFYHFGINHVSHVFINGQQIQ